MACYQAPKPRSIGPNAVNCNRSVLGTIVPYFLFTSFPSLTDHMNVRQDRATLQSDPSGLTTGGRHSVHGVAGQRNAA